MSRRERTNPFRSGYVSPEEENPPPPQKQDRNGLQKKTESQHSESTPVKKVSSITSNPFKQYGTDNQPTPAHGNSGQAMPDKIASEQAAGDSARGDSGPPVLASALPPPPLPSRCAGGEAGRERKRGTGPAVDRVALATKLREIKNEREDKSRKLEPPLMLSKIGASEIEEEDSRELVREDQEVGGSQASGGSLASASFNYVNSIIGSGMIGIPYALAQAGFGLGIFLLCFVAFLTDYSLRIMVTTAELAGVSTYQGIMSAAFGRPGYICLSLVQFIYPFIAMISYNVIAGDTLTKLVLAVSGPDPELETSFLSGRAFLIAISSCLITLPLSLHRDLNKLAKVSFLSIVFVFIIIISVIIRAVTLGPTIPNTEGAWDISHQGIPRAVGIMAFAYMCHHNTFLLYDSLKNKSEEKWKKVTHISVSVSWVIILVCAVGGYSTFTGYTQGDLLESYCWSDTLMNFSRLCFCLTIFFTFPIECFVCRQVLLNVLKKDEEEVGWRLHCGLTLGLVGLAGLASITTDCLGIVLEINGIFAAVPLAFIFPGISYLKLSKEKLLSWAGIQAVVMTTFGIVVAFCGLVILVMQGVPDCSHGQLPWYCSSNNNTTTV